MGSHAGRGCWWSRPDLCRDRVCLLVASERCVFVDRFGEVVHQWDGERVRDWLGQSPSTGQYYSAEWLAPSCNGSGSCSGWISIYKKLSAGSHTQLAFVMASTTNWTAEIRFQAIGGGLYVWMNGVMILNATNGEIATGAPGVGVRSTPSNCALERVDIGHRDSGAPNAPGSLTASRFPQNIRLRWTAPSDPSTITEDAGTGSGVAQYHIWKNGIYQGSFAKFERARAGFAGQFGGVAVRGIGGAIYGALVSAVIYYGGRIITGELGLNQILFNAGATALNAFLEDVRQRAYTSCEGGVPPDLEYVF